MKDYLEGLEIKEGQTKLTEEQVKGILAKNGEMIKTENKKIADSKDAEIENYKTTISNLEKKIEESPKSEELDSLKNEIQQMKDAETQRLADEKKAKEEQIRAERTEEFFKDVKFASNSAKSGVIAEFNKKDFKYDEETNKFQGASEWLEEYKKNDGGAFLSDVANPRFATNSSSPTNDSSMDSLRRAMGLSDGNKK